MIKRVQLPALINSTLGSGVARVRTYARGKKYTCAPADKTTEFEVKRCKTTEEAKAENLL